ncbi:MAG TPA: prepilin-type N-terminal cleavage/methylation domain-containing protein [Rhizomicrobium sp.]|jgi:prepilin-type N-terminal cleavage/methylation domain-containing protein
MRTHRLKTGDDGFTLLEVLVSLAILSVSLATLLGIFSLGLSRARQNEDEMGARTLAQALIAQADAVANPQLGARGGQAGGGYRWQLELKPYNQGTALQTGGTALASVTARVTWEESAGARSLTLSSLRTVPRSATP